MHWSAWDADLAVIGFRVAVCGIVKSELFNEALDSWEGIVARWSSDTPVTELYSKVVL